MKKLFALALVVFGLAACQTEPEGLDVQMGGEQEVMLTVSLPETTRANSAEGFDVANIASTDYTLRYILEIYRVGDTNGTCQRHVLVSDKGSVAFPVRLVPRYNYNVVVWADIVRKDGAVLANGEKADRYYDTQKGLDEITIIENDDIKWNAMDETRDAYTATVTFNDFKVSDLNETISLTRPFAKLRVVATDYEDVDKLGLKPATATVVYSQDNLMPRTYNARTGEATGADSKSHAISYATPVYDDHDATGEYTLFADYIFVPQSGTTVKFLLKVYADGSKLIKENNFNTEIFVQRNKLTTIKGDVLTTGGNVTIKVENKLGELETINYADNAETLQEIINEAPAGEQTNITLGGDIDLGDLFSTGTLSTRAAATLPIVIPEGKVITLDLNGYKITTPFVEDSTTNHAYAFENHGNLTIKDSDSEGKGEIIARGIFNYGTMTLESGTINACDGNGGYGVRNYEGAEFIMNGGSIVTSNEDDNKVNNGGYDATTLRVDVGATATINGGTINNICDYTFAIENHGTTTVKGGTITSVHSTVSTYGTMTINGGTFTCNGINGITAHALVAWDGSETTINGGIFDGKDNYNGFNVDADEGAIVNINGGKFLPVHSGSLYGKGTINVMGGEFFDNPSARVAEGYKVVENETGTYNVVEGDPVAKIGDVEYTTLQKAFAAAQNGDTITFVENVEQVDGVLITDKNLTIDLNGKTFTVSEGASTNNRNFKVNGSSVVTIKNGTMVAEGDYSSGAYGTLRTEGTAKVTLENVKLYSYRGSGLNVKVCTGTTVTINNSEIYSQYGGGVEAAGGTVELNDVTIDQKGVYSGNAWCSVAIGVNGNGKVTVNSGNYSASAISTDANVAQGTWVAYVMSSGGTLDIKGGTFNGVVAETAAASNACGLICADTAAVVEIHGGTFNSNGAILDMRNNTGGQPNPKATLFGGTFSADPRVSGLYASNLITVAEGYKVVENNGRWTLIEKQKNNEIWYESDEMALEPTNPGALNATVVSNVWDKTTGKGVITFDGELTTIGEKAFQRVTNATPSNWATSISLPESVTTIGDYAFAQCYSLTTINIPDSVTSIGQYAFQSCDAVTTVTIGSGVDSIGSSAFYNCYEIKEIICKSTTAPALADKWVFNGVDKVAKVYVPAASVDTYKAAWSMFADKIVAGEF